MTEYRWRERGAPTRLEPQEAARLLARAHELVTGKRPPLELVELELAQLWIETDRTRSAWFHNWGNVTAGESWTGDVWRPPWYELEPDATERHRRLHERMEAGEAPRAFRAYPSAEAGMLDYVRIVTAPSKRAMVEAGSSGDVEAFARAVRESGYCPDCGDGFAAQLSAMRDELRSGGAFDGLELHSSRSSRNLWPVLAVGALWYASER